MTDAPSSTTETKDGAAPKFGVKKVLAALLLPLFFVIVFPLMFVSAIHKPAPNDLSLLVVGPEQLVGQIADGLDETKEFRATHTDVSSEARSSVTERTVDGSIQVTVDGAAASAGDAAGTAAASSPTFTVTTYIANAAGQSVASAVKAVGEQIATELNASVTVVDVAPLVKNDELGITLFYLVVYTSLGAYLTIIVLTQVMPRARLRVKYAAVGIAAVVSPLIVFGLSSIWVGDYNASFGSVAALLGVNALYVFTIGAAAILIEQFLGKSATFGIMLFIVFLNFPSSGGPGPAPILPDFWQFVHGTYFGSGALESFRSIIYFDGNGLSRWLGQLGAWTFGLILVTVIVHLARTTFRQRAELAALTMKTSALSTALQSQTAEPKHVKVETYQVNSDDPLATAGAAHLTERSITTGGEALR